MKLLSAFWLICSLLVLVSFVFSQATDQKNPSAPLQPGVVVEKVASHSEAEKSGIQAGDVLRSWVRADAKGQIASPFDLSQIEIEQAPRGNVTLAGLRGTDTHSWTIGPDAWGIQGRPNFQGKLLTTYELGRDLAAAERFKEAAAQWRAAAVEPQASQVGWLGPWLLLHTAEVLASGHQYEDADLAYQEALQSAQGTATGPRTQLLQSWAENFQKRSDWSNAEKYYEQALAEARRSGTEDLTAAVNLSRLGWLAYKRDDLAKAEEYYKKSLETENNITPGSLGVATNLDNLGLLFWRRGEFMTAEDFHNQALVIRRKLAPDSLAVATSLGNLGTVAWSRSDLEKAEKYQVEALQIRQVLAPESMDLASSFSNLGLIAQDRGDLKRAEEYQRQALAIRQKLAPGSSEVARTLHNLGNLAWSQGDFKSAEEWHRQAVEIMQQLAPKSLDLAVGLNGLGVVVAVRGDLAEAERYFTQALEISKGLAPGSIFVANSLNNLGDVAWARGDLVKAEEYLRQDLAIIQKLAPGSIDVAVALNDLANVAKARKDVAAAENYYNHALAIADKLSPDGLGAALSLQGLGEMSFARHELAKAEQYFRRALVIREKLEPGSAEHAESLAALASVLRNKQSAEAVNLYGRAVDALETQAARLGGSEEVRSEFRAKRSGYYQDYIDLLVQQKQPKEAFHIAERWRARSLLEMLAAARVDIHQGAGPELLQHEHSLQRSLNARRDRRISLLTSNHTAEQVEEIDKEIGELRSEYDHLETKIRDSNPAYAALTQPQPLTSKEVQQLLDNDTLLLEYSLGRERSYLWAITSSSLTAYRLPGQAVVEAAARPLYKQISELTSSSQRDVAPGEKRRTHLAVTASALSRMILGPVAQQLKGKRLLIVADGALQYVPFALLPQPGKPGRSPLILEHEIVYSPSASVLAELRREAKGRQPAPKAVAVLADPVFDHDDPRVNPDQGAARKGEEGQILPIFAQHLTRSAADVGLSHLSRLPYTRREADAIMAVTPVGQGLEAIGFEASRLTATNPDLAQYRIVHFATHGLSDNQHPELSGLVLSLVDVQGKPENGFLDLQDIYNLNLPAELVVLSACETALGKEIRGEGIVGLTRGFMYAGAARVVASLWNTDDVSTKELMEKFYRAMEREGMPPAAALRSAQVAMWKQARWRDPYYWAAFQIQGEWR